MGKPNNIPKSCCVDENSVEGSSMPYLQDMKADAGECPGYGRRIGNFKATLRAFQRLKANQANHQPKQDRHHPQSDRLLQDTASTKRGQCRFLYHSYLCVDGLMHQTFGRCTCVKDKSQHLASSHNMRSGLWQDFFPAMSEQQHCCRDAGLWISPCCVQGFRRLRFEALLASAAWGTAICSFVQQCCLLLPVVQKFVNIHLGPSLYRISILTVPMP